MLASRRGSQGGMHVAQESVDGVLRLRVLASSRGAHLRPSALESSYKVPWRLPGPIPVIHACILPFFEFKNEHT